MLLMTFDEAAFLVDGEIEGAGDVADPATAEPLLGLAEESPDNFAMVDGGEIPEMAKTRAAISLQPVDLGGDPAHRPAIVEGEPQGGLGMGEIGIAAPVELLEPLEIERGGIARIRGKARAAA